MQTNSHEGHIHRDCPCCGEPSATAARLTRYEHPDWPLCRCSACGLIYLEWVPRYEALHDDIAWTKQYDREAQRRRRATPVMTWIDENTRWRLGIFGDATVAGGLNAWAEPGPVLDIGCAAGKTFETLPDRFVPYGIEIDDGAAAIARAALERRGGKLVHADAVSGLQSLPATFFSGVSLWSYLEHEAQPLAVLRETRRVMRQDGIVLIKVPNFGCLNRMVLGRHWSGFRHPDHVQYFTPQTLRGMAERADFKVEFRLYGRIPTNDNMYAKLRPC
jgi:SAM-dependent methyltransferase